MVKTMIVSVVVCWSLFVVNGQIGKEAKRYLPATQIFNPSDEPACIIGAAIDWESTVFMLSFRLDFPPQATRKGYRKMVVMRDVQTQSTHPP
jgi:hypothetical protein